MEPLVLRPRLANPVREPTPWALAVGALVVLAGAGAVAAGQASLTRQLAVGLAGVVAAAAVLLMPRIHPSWPLTLGVVLTVFSGHWSDMGIPTALDRPLIFYGIASAILRTFPDAREPLRIRLNAIHAVMLAVVLFTVGSAIWAGTFTEAEPFFALSERLGIAGFLLFAVAPAVFADRRHRDRLLAGLVILGGWLSLTAFFEYVGPHALVFPRYIVDPSVGIHFGRARGPFVESGAEGLALFVCAVAAAIGAVQARRGWVRVACGAIVILCALGIVMTLTRQVWIGATVGSLLALALAPGSRRYLVPTVLVGAFLVLGSFALVPGLRGDASQRAESEEPVWDRLNSNRAALAMLEARPLLGFGWYTFRERSGAFLRQAPDYPLRTVSRPHNVFLANFAELGLLGGGAWLVALLAAIVTALRTRPPPGDAEWRYGLVAVTVVFVVVASFNPLGSAFPNDVMWLWPGVVLAVTSGAPARRTWLASLRAARPPLASGRGRIPARAVVAGGLCAATAAGAAVGSVVGHGHAPTFTARADLRLGMLRAEALAQPYYLIDISKLAATYGRVGTTDAVLGPASRTLGVPVSDLRARTVVTPVLGVPTVAVICSGATAAEADRTTQVVSDALHAVTTRLATQTAKRERLRRESRRALAVSIRLQTRVADRYGELARQGRRPASIPGDRQIVEGQARANTAGFEGVITGQSSANLRATFPQALALDPVYAVEGMGSNASARTQAYGFAGGVAGLMVALAVLTAVDRRRRRRGLGAPASALSRA